MIFVISGKWRLQRLFSLYISDNEIPHFRNIGDRLNGHKIAQLFHGHFWSKMRKIFFQQKLIEYSLAHCEVELFQLEFVAEAFRIVGLDHFIWIFFGLLQIENI